MDSTLQIEESAAVGERAEGVWLTVPEVMFFESISRRECYNRMRPGDSHFLVSKNRSGSGAKPGKLIYALSMSFKAQERWRAHALASTARPKDAAGAVTESAQLGLLPRAEIDNELAALALPASMRDVVTRRYRVVDLCLNHNWKAENYPSKRAYLRALAKANEISVRQIYRWVETYKDTGKLISLANELPGPEPYTGNKLDDDMRAHLQGCWTLEKLNVRQCYASLKHYLEGKQESPGCRTSYLYKIPSYRTVARFIESLDSLEQAAREGPEALKAACGYIDRTYRDLASLERVETDEWKYDVLAYSAARPTEVKRFWLLTFYDERSTYPLCWKLVEGDRFDKRHGIKEEDEIDLLVCLLREFGVPGALVSDRGRFRTGTFGGGKREGQFSKADGILDRLNIAHEMPREKNPQGNRLERFHRFLADQCRTLSEHGWIGSSDEERKMTHGDAQAELHSRWAAGDENVPRTPLLSVEALRLITDEWMEKWRDHASEGTDMKGLSPRAVFIHNTPEGGFKKLDDERIAWETAEQFDEVTIRTGGIVQLRDGKRYSHPALILIQSERRTVRRVRWDHSQISVLPAAKGEAIIIAPRRERVGTNDPENLARAMELKTKLRKLAGKMVEPRELNMESFLPESAAKPLPEASPLSYAPKDIACEEIEVADFS
ncbi:MAG TPA: hypothetical protein VGY31_06840, partial [Terriglobia bacterium]|nr:hypothetical protein [Terriglobia bacterium]